MVLLIRCQTLLEDLRTTWSCCLYVFYYYHIPSYSLGSIFLSMYIWLYSCLIIQFMYFYCYDYVFSCMTTLSEDLPCFFLSCKANSRVNPAKTGHGSHSFWFLCCSLYFCVVLYIICFVTFSVLFVCICVLYYRHRVATQLQLNIYLNFLTG
jgi:hypothetical protein